MAAWATPADVRAVWSDAPVSDDLLQRLIDAAQEVAEIYAPALATSDSVPARYREAVVLQTQEVWEATQRDGDVLGFDGEYTVRVRPLSSSVKSLLRPKKGAPRLWPRTEGTS